MKKLVAVLLMILLLMTEGTAFSEDKVKIGYLRLTISLPTFVAEERGLFEQAGLKVELTPFESGTIIISAHIAGRIDANCSSATSGYCFAEQSTPDQFKIFLAYGTPSRKNPTFVAIVKKDSPIKELKDLKGKRVGTFPGASSVELARAIIRTQMDPEGVIFQEVPPTILISALADNWKILVFKPLHLNQIYMSILSIGFVILFFGYQFLKDPPQGAYIEKIMFLFLVYSSLEVMHAWSFVKSMDWSFAKEMFNLGQYMSLAVLLPIALYFGARLHFITSVKGEYYEQEVAARPAGITRWRDALDELIIDRFFNQKAIIGRMLVDPNRK